MTAEKQAIDDAEHRLDWHVAQGGRVPKKKREKETVWRDNLCNEKTCDEELIGIGMGEKRGVTLYQSANPEGDQGERKRGAINLHKFGADCAAALGPRFKVEEWTYKARTPKRTAVWHFDLTDQPGSALGKPPGTLFAGVFGMPKEQGQRWVDYDNEKRWKSVAAPVKRMIEEMEADK